MTQAPLSIIAAGDVLPTRRLFVDEQPSSAGLGETVTVIRQADIAFGDFEIPLSRRGAPREKLIAFRAVPEIAQDVGRLGFAVLSLANNHSLDYGYEALFDTMDALRGLGIRCLGAGRNLDEASAPVIVEPRGQRIGFLAFSCLLPTGAAASAERPGIAPIHVHSAYEIDPSYQMEEPGDPSIIRIRTRVHDEDRAYVQQSVQRLRSQVDFLFVSIHWGYGSGEELAEYQRPLGHALIDAGADVVFGNHVHAVHGIEVYKQKAILYSPGTFIGQQRTKDASEVALAIWATMSPDGYLARLELGPNRAYEVQIIPTSLDDNGLPEIARRDVFARIAERIQRLSAKLGTRVDVHDDRIFVPLVGQQ